MIDKIKDMFSFIRPIRIIERPERLIVQDYRPTWAMFLCLAGFVVFGIAFVGFILDVDTGIDSFGMWAAGIASLACFALSFRGTIREVYYFDKTTDSYAFVRQFIHKKETIEGGLSQFRAVRVHREIRSGGDTTRSYRYIVNLLQDGMVLGGAHEQPLREETPILNWHANQMLIASAIASFLKIELHDTSD